MESIITYKREFQAAPIEHISPQTQEQLLHVYGSMQMTPLPHSGAEMVTYGITERRGKLHLFFPSIAHDYVTIHPAQIRQSYSQGDVAQIRYPYGGFDSEAFLEDVQEWVEGGQYDSVSLTGVSFGARQLVDLLALQQSKGKTLPYDRISLLGPILRFDFKHIHDKRLMSIMNADNPSYAVNLIHLMNLDQGMMDSFGLQLDELFDREGYLARLNYLKTAPVQNLNPIDADIRTAYWEKDVITDRAQAEIDTLLVPEMNRTATEGPRLPGFHGHMWAASSTLWQILP
jgi:hypothetical protein